MKTPSMPIVHTQGTHLSERFRAVDRAGCGIPLTGWTGICQVTDRPGGSPLALLDVVIPEDEDERASGFYYVEKPDGSVIDSLDGRLWYFVNLVDDAGRVHPAQQGPFEVEPR